MEESSNTKAGHRTQTVCDEYKMTCLLFRHILGFSKAHIKKGGKQKIAGKIVQLLSEYNIKSIKLMHEINRKLLEASLGLNVSCFVVSTIPH